MDGPQGQQPSLTYLICTTQRSGSQLLCELLRNTRVAGWPAEYYLPRAEADRYHQEALRRKATSGGAPVRELTADRQIDGRYLSLTLRTRVTRNGVFGMKLMREYFDEFVQWLSQVRPNAAGLPPHEIVAAAFPHVSYVHLLRCDKARQAVSLIKARHTKAYESVRVPLPFNEPFRFELMDRQVTELERQDQAWSRYFSGSGIEPINITYEELVDRPRDTVVALLTRLGIAVPDGFDPTEVRLRRQADAVNDAWVAQYRQARAERGRGTWEELCRFVATLPGVTVDPAGANPAMRVRGQVIARLREDGESMMVKTDFGERAALLSERPETFFVTPHHADFPGVLVRLESVDPRQLRELVTEAWRRRASQRMRREFLGAE